MMVYLVHKLPERLFPQPPHLPETEGLVEAAVEHLFEIVVVPIVQIINHRKEIMGEVPDVSPPLIQGYLLDDPDHLIFHRAPGPGRWEEEDTHSLLSPLLASSYSQGWG